MNIQLFAVKLNRPLTEEETLEAARRLQDNFQDRLFK